MTYQRCQMSYVGGGVGVHCLGITAREVHHAVQLLDLPKAQWSALVDAVQHMGRIAAGLFNDAAGSAIR